MAHSNTPAGPHSSEHSSGDELGFDPDSPDLADPQVDPIGPAKAQGCEAGRQSQGACKALRSTRRSETLSLSEVRMSTDSSFNDKRPDSVPTTPEKDIDPVLDPDSPLRDPLARPVVVPTEHPQGWKDPSAGDGIPGDDQMPLPND